MAKWFPDLRCVLVAGMFVSLCANARADTESGLVEFRQGLFAEAFQDWQNAAATGDARAALFIGVLYDSGLGTHQDSLAALAWYRRAAEQGSAPAAFNVAVMLDSGLGAPRDSAQALTWYKRAADKGFARAQYNLAVQYESGSGVPRNIPQAITLYRKAAAQGLTAARDHLQQLGVNVALISHPVGETAMDEFRQAQQVFLRRNPGDIANATEIFRRAAERNNPLAEYDLAYCYEHGLGVPQSSADAYVWYRRAADHADNSTLKSIALAGLHGNESQLTATEHEATSIR